MTAAMTRKVIVIGVGNEYRRDDGAGPAVIARLRASGRTGAVLASSGGETTELIDLWDGAALAVVVDALRTAPAHPGRVHRLAVYRPPSERARAASSHGMDLGDAVELARVLGRLPDRLVLFAIEAADVRPGVGLSAPVAAAVDRVAEEIAGEVAVAAVRAAGALDPTAGALDPTAGALDPTGLA
jgi:hydrogenase maturation protease